MHTCTYACTYIPLCTYVHVHVASYTYVQPYVRKYNRTYTFRTYPVLTLCSSMYEPSHRTHK